MIIVIDLLRYQELRAANKMKNDEPEWERKFRAVLTATVGTGIVVLYVILFVVLFL